MIERCQACKSTSPDVRLIAWNGNCGKCCGDNWHTPLPNQPSDPNVLQLTDYDRAMLKGMCVGVEDQWPKQRPHTAR
jgi:hypothetical protein